MRLYSPIKALCHAIELNPWWIAFIAGMVVFGLLAANLKELVYFMVKVRQMLIDRITYSLHEFVVTINDIISSNRFFSTLSCPSSSHLLKYLARRMCPYTVL